MSDIFEHEIVEGYEEHLQPVADRMLHDALEETLDKYSSMLADVPDMVLALQRSVFHMLAFLEPMPKTPRLSKGFNADTVKQEIVLQLLKTESRVYWRTMSKAGLYKFQANARKTGHAFEGLNVVNILREDGLFDVFLEKPQMPQVDLGANTVVVSDVDPVQEADNAN